MSASSSPPLSATSSTDELVPDTSSSQHSSSSDLQSLHIPDTGPDEPFDSEQQPSFSVDTTDVNDVISNACRVSRVLVQSECVPVHMGTVFVDQHLGMGSFLRILGFVGNWCIVGAMHYPHNPITGAPAAAPAFTRIWIPSPSVCMTYRLRLSAIYTRHSTQHFSPSFTSIVSKDLFATYPSDESSPVSDIRFDENITPGTFRVVETFKISNVSGGRSKIDCLLPRLPVLH